MKHWRILLIAFSIILALAAGYVSWFSVSANRPVVINQTAVPPLPALNPDKVTQGEDLYAIHCAQCHGVDLKGSPT
ncbi:MAG: cytochrome c [Chloroflexi bacterium]|nr:cytochrome c [Chloroflexota bacterium]